MKKILILCVFLSIITPLSAKKLYIKVMSVSHSDLVFTAQYDINKLGYKMYFSKYKQWYRIYAGTFDTKISASKALIKVRENISKDAFIVDLTIKDNDVKSEKMLSPIKIKKQVLLKKEYPPKKNIKIQSKILKTKTETIAQKKEEGIDELIQTISTKAQSKNKFFIGISSGISKVNVDEYNSNGNVPLNFKLDDSGVNYGVEIGYYFNENIFTTINYQFTDLDTVSINDMFATLNYKFDKIYSNYPYIGFITGYSMMTWKEEPIDAQKTTDSASSFLGGVQIGSEIIIYQDISMYILYRYIIIDNITNIKTNSGEKNIEYTNQQNLNIGIRYNF